MQKTPKDELEDLLNKQDKTPISTDIQALKPHYVYLKYQEEQEFVQKCCESKYTEACLELMKEGKVPFRLINAIIKDSTGIWNTLLSFFKRNVSLESLIGKYNIAILKNGDKCIALDPHDGKEKNKEKIQTFFNNTENTGRFFIRSHGSGAYREVISIMQDDNSDTTLYLSNIQNGFIATNTGIKERFEKYNDIILSSLHHFNSKNEDINNVDNDNNHDIIIHTYSYSNLLGAKIAKTLVENNYTISELNLMNVANGYYFFQNADDIANTILSIKPDAIGNIKEINTASDGSTFHPVENGTYLARKLQQGALKTKVNNTFVNLKNTKKYNGTFKDGKYDGHGELEIYNKKGKLKEQWEGKFKNGMFTGQGTKTCFDYNGQCRKYQIGQFKDNHIKECIKEKSFYPNGKPQQRYNAILDKNSKLTGEGICTQYDENGNLTCKYTAYYENDYPHSKYPVKLIRNDNNKRLEYLGDLIDGVYDGYGKLKIYNNEGNIVNEYSGNFKDGVYDGDGKLKIYNNEGNVVNEYSGEFKDGEYDGYGQFKIYNNKGKVVKKYSGEFKSGRIHDNRILEEIQNNQRQLVKHKVSYKDCKEQNKYKNYIYDSNRQPSSEAMQQKERDDIYDVDNIDSKNNESNTSLQQHRYSEESKKSNYFE